MSEERKVIVKETGFLMEMAGILAFAVAIWLLNWLFGGGLAGHCREYPSATICTAVYGATGPHAEAPDATTQKAGGER